MANLLFDVCVWGMTVVVIVFALFGRYRFGYLRAIHHYHRTIFGCILHQLFARHAHTYTHTNTYSHVTIVCFYPLINAEKRKIRMAAINKSSFANGRQSEERKRKKRA